MAAAAQEQEPPITVIAIATTVLVAMLYMFLENVTLALAGGAVDFMVCYASPAHKRAGARPKRTSSNEQQEDKQEDKQEEEEKEKEQEPPESHSSQEAKQSKRAWQRQEEAQLRYERSREGRKLYKVSAYVTHDVYGKLYCACTMDFRWRMPLPSDFQIAEREWRAIVLDADKSSTWRRTRHPADFFEALKALVNEKVEQRRKIHQRRGKQPQPAEQAQQWDMQPPRDQGSNQQPAAHTPLRGRYAAAAAEQPDPDSMSAGELRAFVQQSGSSVSAQASTCCQRDDLVSLARRSLQVWECRRIISCSRLPQSSTEQELLAALCVLRLAIGQGPRQARAAADAATAAELKRRYQRLALLIHPDKVYAEHQHLLAEFEEAFKVLNRANELLSK